MNKSFSRIERDVVLDFIAKALPELQIYKNGEHFLLLLPGTYIVARETIIFNRQDTLGPLSGGDDIRVHFYYFNRGLYFESYLAKSDSRVAIPISKDIFKVSERNSEATLDFSGEFQFEASNNIVRIPCSVSKHFPLFVEDTKRISYPKDPSVYGDILASLEEIPEPCKQPIASFLSSKREKNFAVLGTADPVHVLYISEKLVIIGGGSNNFPFIKYSNYMFLCRIGMRSLKTLCTVESVFSHSDKQCAVCSYMELKPEDKRFLFEKLYKRIFN